uniref:Uncharacterized protein n=1 Tax=Panstrongylus lignarius TaxID=156445 RepID=A0A224XY37_9HEMI
MSSIWFLHLFIYLNICNTVEYSFFNNCENLTLSLKKGSRRSQFLIYLIFCILKYCFLLIALTDRNLCC